MMDTLAVAYDRDELFLEAEALSKRLQLPIDNAAQDRLLVTADRLQLEIHPFSPICTDFSREFWQKRKEDGKKQGLVRACKPKPGMCIVDATAGWGRDAAVLASFGAEVLMLERNPVLAALLEDGLKHQDEHSKMALRLQVINQDAITWLGSLKAYEFPDVIYIDPMHPCRQKSALVKKDLQILQQMIGPDDDALALINLARCCVVQKVVVKWPQNLPALLEPSASITGKTVRFDMYTPQRG